MERIYGIVVWFATSSAERTVATRTTLDDAKREAARYLGADARGVWIQHPNGDYEDLTGRGFSPLTVSRR